MCAGVHAANQHRRGIKKRQTAEGVSPGRKLIYTGGEVERDLRHDWSTELCVRGRDRRAKTEHRNQAQHREPFDNFPFHTISYLLSASGAIECPKLRPPTFTFWRAKLVRSLQ